MAVELARTFLRATLKRHLDMIKDDLSKCQVITIQLMPEVPMKRMIFVSFLFLLIIPTKLLSKDVENVISEGEVRLKENQSAQTQIDKVSSQTQDIVADYHEKIKIVDGLKIYNKLLSIQLNDQTKEMETLLKSITNAAVIERQILPMLLRMTDSIDQFIDRDTPFLFDERKSRVKTLRKLIASANLSNAEKTRRVFEAFQIENDYGNTIEAYKGKLNLGEKTYDVDFLRIGRVAFLYRSVGGEEYGYWDVKEKQWSPLTASHYQRNIDRGIKIAMQEVAPELITIPVKLLGGDE